MNLFVPLGVGVTRHTAGGPTAAPRLTSTVGLHAGLGFRAFLSQNVAFRAEGRMTYDTYEEAFNNGKSNAFNGQGNVGLSFFAGTGRPIDTDGDGIFDRRDRCAATPRGATVDANGCPADADRDGVFNGIDRCANTPAGTAVDATGCPRDADGDGVNDSADRCAATPAGTRVDANGCPLDADGDGVADAADRCPNTARGTAVDANGCPRDADADGVPDAADRCPNSPAGQPVDATGCARDADGDGVADAADRCPNTVAGTRVDATGCALAPDADHDNVEDSKDRCPNTPAGRRVDANGCPIFELPAVGANMPIRNIAFVTGRSTLLPESFETLDQVAAGILTVPGSRFEIAGHTDSRGGAAMNRTLSRNRAMSVVNYLVRKGVARSRLTARGYGPDVPIGDNSNDTGRAQNRRVEIKRLS
jgi:outer membrane protein OmpA-like peptidoglycan-associated protein